MVQCTEEKDGVFICTGSCMNLAAAYCGSVSTACVFIVNFALSLKVCLNKSTDPGNESLCVALLIGATHIQMEMSIYQFGYIFTHTNIQHNTAVKCSTDLFLLSPLLHTLILFFPL